MATIDNLQINVSSNVNDVTSSFDRLGNAVNNLKKGNVAINSHTKAVSKSASTWGKLVRSIGRIGFYRSIRWTIKNLSQGIKEGTDNFYEYSKAVNGSFAQSMDRAATSIAYLKNSLGTAFAPLVEMAVPYLEAAVDKFVEFINKINELRAYLSGEDYFYKATKTAKQYNTAVKEAKKSLLGFDEINRLSNDSSSASDSSLDFVSELVDKNAMGKLNDSLQPVLENLETLKNLFLKVSGIELIWKGIKGFSDESSENDLTSAFQIAMGAATGLGVLALGSKIASGFGLGRLSLLATSAIMIWRGIHGLSDGSSENDLSSAILTALGVALGAGTFLSLKGGKVGEGFALENIFMLIGGISLIYSGIKAMGNEGEDDLQALTMMLVGSALTANGLSMATGKGLAYSLPLTLKFFSLSLILSGAEIQGEADNIEERWKARLLELIGFSFLSIAAIGSLGSGLVIAVPVTAMFSLTMDIVWNKNGSKDRINDAVEEATNSMKISEKELEGMGFWEQVFAPVSKLPDVIKSFWDGLTGTKKPTYTTYSQPGRTATTNIAPTTTKSKNYSEESTLHMNQSKAIMGGIGFATGGFPEDGLFFANHNEIVGQFSNGKTAVANNAQIVEGISEGVYEAVTAAMNGKGDGTVCVYLDGKLIARETAKRQYQMSKALGV